MPGVAVLTSGGMDSCAMLANTAQRDIAHPIYVKTGMIWEAAELAALDRFLQAIASPNLMPLTILELPAKPLLGAQHWTMSHDEMPDYDAPDETVYIPGRNIVLISLAAIWCSTNNVHQIQIGTLAGNPFPDATPEFRELIAKSNSVGLDHPLTISAPLSNFHKQDILIKFGTRFPLHLTLTCANPANTAASELQHCGACNKCRERHEAYAGAGIPDLTTYKAPIS